MGSFDQTCAISGLPVTSYMPVRYMLLMDNNPRAGSMGLYSTEWWAPRTFPIKGVYSDCGDLEPVEPSAQTASWIRGFQEDLVEHGTGSNPCHDKAVFKDTITFDSISDLIHEGMLYVEREPGTISRRAHTKKSQGATLAAEARGEFELVPETDKHAGVPTLRQVRSDIIRAGGSVALNWNTKGYLIHEVRHGDVTVRWSIIGTAASVMENLTLIRPALEAKYQVIVVTGSHREPMLRLFPKLEETEFWGFEFEVAPSKYERLEETAMISKALIREDVWQALVSLGIDGGYDYENGSYPYKPLPRVTVDDYIKAARAVYDAYVAGVAKMAAYESKRDERLAAKAEFERRKAAGELQESDAQALYDDSYSEWRNVYKCAEGFFDSNWDSPLRGNLIMETIARDSEGRVGGTSLRDHFKWFVAESPNEAEVEEFLRTVAETVMVCTMMTQYWRHWIPSTYAGQDKNVDENVRWTAAIAQVAADWKREYDAEYGESEDEDDADDPACPSQNQDGE